MNPQDMYHPGLPRDLEPWQRRMLILHLVRTGVIQFYYRDRDIALVCVGIIGLVLTLVIDFPFEWVVSCGSGALAGIGSANMAITRRRARDWINTETSKIGGRW